MGPSESSVCAVDLRLATASLTRSRGLPNRYPGSYLGLPLVPQLNFTIPADLLDRIDAAKPNYLDRKGFLCLLLEQQLDRAGTLGLASASEASPSSSYSSSSLEVSIPKNKNKGRSKGKSLTSYPEAFEEFWRAYQSLPVKASKQSKPLALAAWEDACAHHPPEDLSRALQALLELQQRELRSERGFTVAMPDCFRWLRDECYLALLEAHTPAKREGDWI